MIQIFKKGDLIIIWEDDEVQFCFTSLEMKFIQNKAELKFGEFFDLKEWDDLSKEEENKHGNFCPTLIVHK